MKKLLGIVGVLLGFGMVAFAATPQDQPLPGQIPYSNASIVGSTASTTSNANLTASVSPGTLFNGTSASCRNCFTNFMVQIPTTTVLNVLDGGTTVYYVFGTALGTSGVNTFSTSRDRLGPLCLTAGTATTFNLVNTNGVSTNPQVLNYEGYTQCGQPNQGGVMK
jgi:hypothetical protein